MTKETNSLFAEYTIDTPESVTFDYQIAGIGSRFIGVLIDHMLQGVTLGAITLLLVSIMAAFETSPIDIFTEATSWESGMLMAGYFLLEFLLMWGYFTFFEIVWQGQTPGKRVANTRVIHVTGGPAPKLAIVIRNLVRIIDWLPWAYIVGIIAMMFNDQSRRLGDFAAGTMVIRMHPEEKIDTLSPTSGINRAIQRWLETLSLEQINQLYAKYPRIEKLTPEEYELAEEATYGPQALSLGPSARPRLARILSPKVGGPLPDPPDSDIEATLILKEIVLLYNIHSRRGVPGNESAYTGQA